MFTCVICRFEAELDDVIAPTRRGRCVCLRCFSRETDSSRQMSKDLRRDLSMVLGTAGVA
jgi:hypothetical protein